MFFFSHPFFQKFAPKQPSRAGWQLPGEVRGDDDGHGPRRATEGLLEGPGAEVGLGWEKHGEMLGKMMVKLYQLHILKNSVYIRRIIEYIYYCRRPTTARWLQTHTFSPANVASNGLGLGIEPGRRKHTCPGCSGRFQSMLSHDFHSWLYSFVDWNRPRSMI